MKKIVNHTICYALSLFLMKGISLLMLPITADNLTAQEFGLLEILGSLAIIGSILIGFGLEEYLYRHAGEQKDIDIKKSIAGNVFGITLIFGFISLAISIPLATVISPMLPVPITSYQLSIIFFMLSFEGIISISLGWIRMLNRCYWFCIISCMRAGIHASLIVIFLSLDRGVEGVLEAGLIAVIIQAIILSIVQYNHSNISFSFQLLNKSLSYALPIVGSGLVMFLINGADRWIIVNYINLEALAIFSVAAKFGLAAAILLQPFGMWWSPKRFEVLYGESGPDKVACFSLIGILCSMIIGLFVAFLAPIAIYSLLPEAYHYSAKLVPYLVLAMVLKEISEIVNIGCFIKRTTHLYFSINIASGFICVILMYFLVKDYELIGVSISLCITYFFRLILIYFVSQNSIKLSYPVSFFCISFLIFIFFLFRFDFNQILFDSIFINIIELFFSIFCISYFYWITLKDRLFLWNQVRA